MSWALHTAGLLAARGAVPQLHRGNQARAVIRGDLILEAGQVARDDLPALDFASQ